MPGLHHETDDTAKLLRRPMTETPHEHDEAPDPTILKFDGPVELSDEDVGSDPYNRTGRFRRLIR
jgi:hypothetical protein